PSRYLSIMGPNSSRQPVSISPPGLSTLDGSIFSPNFPQAAATTPIAAASAVTRKDARLERIRHSPPYPVVALELADPPRSRGRRDEVRSEPDRPARALGGARGRPGDELHVDRHEIA